MLKIKRFVFNPFFENTYILWDEHSKECAIIDPGCFDSEEKEALSDFIDSKKMVVKYLLNTHCHIDHVFGNKFVKDTFNPQYYAPQEDLFLLEMMEEQASSFGLPFEQSPKPDFVLNKSSEISLGNFLLTVLETPGHSPGEVCLYSEESKLCITGDVLFHGSIGRTDLWGGNYEQLISSIKEKLFTLPDEVTIYPGHESESTIGFERINNPFLAN
jgi:glyoxylase-like metal-dependent hydrolase (beta-lactamase superfamily II)